MRTGRWFVAGGLLLLSASPALASANGHGGQSLTEPFTILLGLALLAVLAGSLFQKFGQAEVLAHLALGLFIAATPFRGPILSNEVIRMFAELGINLLMFEVGLECDLQKMKRAGPTAFGVAAIGVVVPLLLIYLVSKWLNSGKPEITHWWIAAAGTATSVGITSMVLKRVGKLNTPAGNITIGAAVFDDVIGMVILSIVSTVARGGDIQPMELTFQITGALCFIVIAAIFGGIFAGGLSKIIRVTCGDNEVAKLLFALLVLVSFGFLAEKIGLQSIIGAFVGGLVLDGVHFKKYGVDYRVEHIIALLRGLLVPIFFLTKGLEIQVEQLVAPSLLVLIAAVSIMAIVGKLVSGVAFLKQGKLRGAVAVGTGMVGRGEVGIVFAAMGVSMGKQSPLGADDYAVVMGMVIVTTLVAPTLINMAYSDYPANWHASDAETMESEPQLIPTAI